MLLSEEELASIVDARYQHSKVCSFTPTYDLSQHKRVVLSCVCGWNFEVTESTLDDQLITE